MPSSLMTSLLQEFASHQGSGQPDPGSHYHGQMLIGPEGGQVQNLQEHKCPGCPPLSINSPLACGAGVASNSLIYAAAVLLTN